MLAHQQRVSVNLSRRDLGNDLRGLRSEWGLAASWGPTQCWIAALITSKAAAVMAMRMMPTAVGSFPVSGFLWLRCYAEVDIGWTFLSAQSFVICLTQLSFLSTYPSNLLPLVGKGRVATPSLRSARCPHFEPAFQ
jgi:hypothetical protein